MPSVSSLKIVLWSHKGKWRRWLYDVTKVTQFLCLCNYISFFI